MTKARIANIGVWTLTTLTGALFLLSALPKFAMPGWITRFAAWGYPQWFLYVIAVLEAAGAVALFVPRLAPYAAGGLIIVMLGAVYTHITHDESIVWNFAYIASLTVIGLYRWRQFKGTEPT